MKKINILIWLSILVSTSIYSGESSIPLQRDARLPSNDLVFNDQVLSSKEAIELKNIDLALLNPAENEIYNGLNNLTTEEQGININTNDEIRYEGAILSNSGLLRFNAISETDGSIITIHLDKAIHTMLLRKNFLRRIGYNIPAMKYLEKVKVNFKNISEKNDFLKKIIPENTLGASERWVVENNDLTVTLQDVVVTSPNESDFYNLAMGVPGDVINSRTIRGLVGAYSLLNLEESVNQFSWINGKIDNRLIVLNHFTGNEFNSSIDDVIWMQRKINQLSRADIAAIVELSKFPKGVSELIIEKIISRRNSTNKILNIKIVDLQFNSKISIDKIVLEGKLVEQNYPGFASRFSYGDSQTPFDQIRFYLYSKLQSNIIDNAVTYLNKNIEGFDISGKRGEYFQKQFETGLKHFIETGELLPIKVGAWVSPIANLRLILSRDIILGNYLGAENLVQLADTFGAGIDLGMMIGVEGLPYGASGGVSATASLVRTFTHLKPVKSLKLSLKEPYRNLFVPLLKKSLKDNYLTLSELKEFKGTTEERSKKIQNILNEMDKSLNVGESLIMTDRFMPTASVDVSYSQGIVGAGVGLSGSVAVIKRIHFYKKAPQVLQVFDDLGQVKTIDLSFHLTTVGIPFLNIHQALDTGKYNIKSYMVNLSSNLEENPAFFQNALGIYEVLKNKNFEIINSNTKPVKVNATFKDKTTGFSFLLWKFKKVKGQTFYDVEARDGVSGKYYSYQKDFMSGANIESMSKQIANYYLRESLDPNISITDESDKNPGETFYGRAHSETYRFEAEINEVGGFSKKFLSLVDVRQGWTQSEKQLKKFIEKTNSKFNLNLFNKEQIDFEKLKLYKIGYHLNLYESGIDRLSHLKNSDLDQIESKYKKNANCSFDDQSINTLQCGDLRDLRAKIKKCSIVNLEEASRAVCLTELFERTFSDLKFDDFRNLMGENNFYLFASIDGFRAKSEILNDTIYSNSLGKIGSQYWNGPFEVVRSLIGLTDGEFSGGWLR